MEISILHFMRVSLALTSVLIFSFNAGAQMTSTLENLNNTGSEYFVGRDLGRPLVTVNLLNGVTRPGVYHVPIKTNLPQLIAYAGGTTTNADTSEITLRRYDPQKAKVLRFSLDHALTSEGDMPTIEDKDMVSIPQKASLDTTLRWVALIAGFTSIALSISMTNQILRHP